MKLNIRMQLLVGFGLVLLATLLVGWEGLDRASAINTRSELLYTDDLASMSRIAELSQLIFKNRVSELEHVLSAGTAAGDEFQLEITQQDQAIDAALQNLRTS